LARCYHSKITRTEEPNRSSSIKRIERAPSVIATIGVGSVKLELVPRNAAVATDPPKPRSEEIRPLNAAQAKAFLSAARGDRFEALHVLAVTAGLRISELLAWTQVG
jgi:integrase